MQERVLGGRAASPGGGAGPARVLRTAAAGESGPPLPESDRAAEAERAAAALDAAGRELEAIAAELRAAGRAEEAEIVDTGALMAADPALLASAERRIREQGVRAPAAIGAAADEHAEALARIGDETLAARADDVLSLGRRAARIARGEGQHESAGGRVVLVADDLGPADVAELGDGVEAIALSAGAVTAHAAIVARSLGIPMVVCAGTDLLEAADGDVLVVDGGTGEVALVPSQERRAHAEAAQARRERARQAAARDRALPAATVDGHAIAVLVNAAGAAEAAKGMEAGAAGIGLLRTELAFLEAGAWPTVDGHLRALRPVIERAQGRPVTVRVLDFGGDKTPPFLRGADERGIALLLRHPDALADQLEAIVRAAGGSELRVMLPMVSSAAEVREVRSMLAGQRVQLGAMIETREAVAAIDEIVPVCDFLSIGTNDLTHSALDSDRFSESEAVTHHPRVLDLIARTVDAATGAHVPLEVCGEAASDPRSFPLLVGLGVDELSVGASRVGAVRAWTRALDYMAVRRLAREALGLADAAEVALRVGPIARRLMLLEAGDAGGQGVQSGNGVVALGGQA